VIEAISAVFASGGTEEVMAVLRGNQYGGKAEHGTTARLGDHLRQGEVGAISAQNRRRWIEGSEQMREQVRGESVGALG
jgi:hypothetical protein